MKNKFLVLNLLLLYFIFARSYADGQIDGFNGIEQKRLADDYCNKAVSFNIENHYDSAAKYFSKASRFYNPVTHSLEYCRSLKNAGRNHYVDIFDSSLIYFDSLSTIAKIVLDTSIYLEKIEYYHILYFLARNLRVNGEYQKSSDVSEAAILELQKSNDSLSSLMLFFHHKNLANINSDQSLIERAIDYNIKALKFLNRKDYINYAKVFTNLGILYQEQDNIDYAITYLELGLKLWYLDEKKYIKPILECHELLCNAYGTIEERNLAQKHFQSIEELMSKYPEFRFNDLRFFCLKMKGIDIESQSYVSMCKEYVFRYLPTSRSDSLIYIYEFVNIARHYLALENYDSAKFYCNKGILYNDKIQDNMLNNFLFYNKSYSELHLGNTNNSLVLIENSLQSLYSNHAFNSHDRINYYSVLARTLTLKSKIYHNLYNCNLNKSFLDTSIIYSEKATKAMIYFMSKYMSPFSNHFILYDYKDVFYHRMDVEVSSYLSGNCKLIELIKTCSNIKRYNSNLIFNNIMSRDTLSEKEFLAHLFKSNREYEGVIHRNRNLDSLILISEKIIQCDSIFYSYKLKRDFFEYTPSIDSIQFYIPSNSTIIDYYHLPDKILAFQISKNDILVRVVDIHNENFQKLVNGQRYCLSMINNPKLNEISKELSGILFRDMILSNEISHLFIIPDRAIANVIFDLLYKEGDDKYLIERFDISFLISINNINHRKMSNSYYKYTYVGFSPFSGEDGIGHSMKLPNSLNELYSFSYNTGLYDNAIFLIEDEAHYANFQYYIAKSKIFHISSHYSAQENSLLVYDRQFKKNTKMVGQYEIFDLKLNNHLVILNSCGGNYGSDLVGFVENNMANAIFLCGAKNVVSPHWNIPDYFAHDFMKVFSINYNNCSISEAMSKTKRYFIQKKTTPYLWSGYKVLGFD